jgi:hypothetical protein
MLQKSPRSSWKAKTRNNRDEVVASLVFGAMVTFVFALVWGRQFVDLVTGGP